MTTTIQLPVNAFDFESIKTSLSANLNTYNSWKGYLPTQTGTTLVDFTATVGSSISLKSLRYFQEAFSSTASSDRGIYSIADMQGVRLIRKRPASMVVTVAYTAPNAQAPQSVTLPRFAQFQGGGTYWFSRDSVTVTSGGTAQLTMYQGYTVLNTTAGLDSDFQAFQSQEDGFMVSDEDVYVFVNATPLTRTTGGLWNYKSQAAFQDRTTPQGQLLIKFGNDYYGSKPKSSDAVAIVYAVTSGADANGLNMLTAKISQVSNPVNGISFTVVTNPNSGANQVSPAQFKHTGAISFGTFNSSVTKNQYAEAVLTYPGVVDAITFSQREIDPTDVRKMNLIKVVLLTDTTWTPQQKSDYLEYLSANTMYVPVFYLESPVPRVASVTGKIYVHPWANPSTCQSDAQDAITALFALKAGSLGYDISLNDIHRAVTKSNEGIDWFDLFTPTSDLIVSSNPMDAPTAVVGSGGLLAVGTYAYAVAPVMANGIIAPKNWVTVAVTSPNSSVQLTWRPYPGAVSYKVYGRSGTQGYGVLASPTDATPWTDSGAATPGATVPTSNTTPIQYNTLSSVAFEVAYTSRGARSS